MSDIEIGFENADEFLRFLRLSSGNWGDGWESPWVFRGHEDHQWQLIPRAWRSHVLEEFSAVVKRLEPAAQEGWAKIKEGKIDGFTTHDPPLKLVNESPEEAVERVPRLLLQLAFESDVLRDFVLLAEELGYEAGDPAKHMDGATVARHPQPRRLFSQTMSEEAGLAQHHGIPTRLLDWTRRPEVAAFFAALGPGEGRLAVWALDIRACRKPTRSYSPTVALLTCRRHKHSFLHAQDGLFTYVPFAESYYLEFGQWPSVSQVLGQDIEHQQHIGVTAPLRRLTLPSSERSELVRLLWREKVSQAHLMPTYDYIAKSLRLRWSLGLETS